jgi:hypothetical protein
MQIVFNAGIYIYIFLLKVGKIGNVNTGIYLVVFYIPVPVMANMKNNTIFTTLYSNLTIKDWICFFLARPAFFSFSEGGGGGRPDMLFWKQPDHTKNLTDTEHCMFCSINDQMYSNHNKNMQSRDELSSVFMDDPFICSAEYQSGAAFTRNKQSFNIAEDRQSICDQMYSEPVAMSREEQMFSNDRTTPQTGNAKPYKDSSLYSRTNKNPPFSGADKETVQGHYSSAENTQAQTLDGFSEAQVRQRSTGSLEVSSAGQVTWASADCQEWPGQNLGAGLKAGVNASTDLHGKTSEHSRETSVRLDKNHNTSLLPVGKPLSKSKSTSSNNSELRNSGVSGVHVADKDGEVQVDRHILSSNAGDSQGKNVEIPVEEEGIFGILSRLESVIDAVEKASHSNNKASNNQQDAQEKINVSDCEEIIDLRSPPGELQQVGRDVNNSEEPGQMSKTIVDDKVAFTAAERRSNVSVKSSLVGDLLKKDTSGRQTEDRVEDVVATIKDSRRAGKSKHSSLFTTAEDCTPGT